MIAQVINQSRSKKFSNELHMFPSAGGLAAQVTSLLFQLHKLPVLLSWWKAEFRAKNHHQYPHLHCESSVLPFATNFSPLELVLFLFRAPLEVAKEGETTTNN